jgi:DNA polymerase III delta prime subunit
MALRGIKPKEVKKRLKVLFYGSAGVGKTTAAIQFPQPYLIDTEKGAENEQYVKLLTQNEGSIFQTTDFNEMIDEVKALLSEKHPYKTLIIDPLTTVYNDLLEKCAAELKKVSKEKDATGTEFGRHYGEANKKMKHLLTLLLRLDMNVIITSHAKNEYGDNMKVLGVTFDCYKKLDYLFDLVFEVQKRGSQRVGIVKKTRIEAFADNENFPFSYESIADKYGKDVLEREAVPVQLASKEQIDTLNHLIELLKIEDDVKQKWLDKSDSENFSEMNSTQIQACIDMLNKKLDQKIIGEN